MPPDMQGTLSEDDRESRVPLSSVKKETEPDQVSTPSTSQDIAVRDVQQDAGTLAAFALENSRESLGPSTVYHQSSLPYVGSSATAPPSSDDKARLDAQTAEAIAAAQNEYNTRVRGPKKQPENMVPTTEMDLSEPSLKNTPISAQNTKKHPTPKPTDPSKSTSVTVKRPPAKKRKVDSSEERSAPTSIQKSPATSNSAKGNVKAGSTSKPKKTSLSSKAASPLRSSPTAASDGSDDEVYCICRKKDDHSFMIGCDGGCDDWFHGRCVDVKKDDESLIDKFICPICTEKGKGVTTWKPMCRREGCRRPARLRKGEESKYCSDACGVQFMNATVHRASMDASARGLTKQRLKPEAITEVSRQLDLDTGTGPLGGPIGTHELKALASSTSNAEDFRNLGMKLPTPPHSASPQDDPDALQPAYTDQELKRLAEIEERKQLLKQRRQLLKIRGQFVTVMKTQRDRTAEKMKVKDICGFDSRWTMDDVAFKAWRATEEGNAIFENGSSDADATDVPNAANGIASTSANAGDSNTYICTRKRCERHRQWQKLVLQDVRFEEADVGNEMRRIDTEEKDIKQGAIQRAKGLEKSGVASNQSWDGWVEEVLDEDPPNIDHDIRMED